MFSGLFFGAIAAFFWSLTNIIDKYLTNKHAADGNIWGILVLSCLFPAILLPISAHFGNIEGSVGTVSILMFVGALMVGWIYFYLKALVEDDTSVVMTILVLAPFFSLLFSSLILGEMLTTTQMIGGALLIVGSLVVTYTPRTGKFKYKLLYYALAASVVMGLMHTIFKFVTVEEVFWQSMFWRSFGMVITGILLCFLFTKIRNSFLDFLLNYSKRGLGMNSANETLTLVGDTIFGFAILLAPIALIQTTEAYQPIFIIIIISIMTAFGFDVAYEDNSKEKITQKFIGITLVIVGSLILVLNS